MIKIETPDDGGVTGSGSSTPSPSVIPTETSFFVKHKNALIGVALVAVMIVIGFLVK